MIDLHCHVLPGIDDGPGTMEESLELCRLAVERGVRTIVATPHVSFEYPDNDAARIAAGVAEVNAALQQSGIALEVLAGAEVAALRAAELGDDELRALRLGGGPWLLLEPPFTMVAPGFDLIMASLQSRGHRILLAHPERAPHFLRDRARLESCVQAGMRTAVTAGALGRRFGREVQRYALEMLRDGLVHMVASDAHGPHLGRPPGLAEDLIDQGWESHVDHLCRAAPEAILTGGEQPEAPPAPPPRNLLRRIAGL